MISAEQIVLDFQGRTKSARLRTSERVVTCFFIGRKLLQHVDFYKNRNIRLDLAQCPGPLDEVTIKVENGPPENLLETFFRFFFEFNIFLAVFQEFSWTLKKIFYYRQHNFRFVPVENCKEFFHHQLFIQLCLPRSNQ